MRALTSAVPPSPVPIEFTPSAGFTAAAVVVGLALLVVGSFLAVLGAVNVRRELRDRRRTLRLGGEVVGAEWGSTGGAVGEPGVFSFPVVRYATPDGELHVFRADIGTNTPMPVRTAVAVLHDPTGRSAPQLAGLRGRLFVPVGFGLLGSALGLGGLIVLVTL